MKSKSIKSLIDALSEAQPDCRWASFYLSGGGDDFDGFQELDICLDGKIVRRPSKEELDNSHGPTGTDLDNIVNESDNQGLILERVLPKGEGLNCADTGWCRGCLLVVLKDSDKEESVSIAKEDSWGGYSWKFLIQPGFRGLMIDYYNYDEASASTETAAK